MKRKLKSIFCMAIAVAMGLCVSGCDLQKKGDVKTIGLAMPAKSLERWNRDGEYLKKLFEKEGYNVELRYSDNNTDQQVNDIQVLIADDVDVLLIAAVDGSTLFRTLEDAQIKNIPVIAYDRLIMNTDAVDCYVSFDNYSVGEIQGKYVIDALKADETSESYNIELVTGDTADNNAAYFRNGAVDTIKSYLDSGKFKIPSGKIEAEQTATPGWATDIALENMQNTLASYYSDGTKLDAVICSSDVLSIGVVQAIRSDYNGGNMPVITGQDGDIAALKNIVDGNQSMTVYKNVSDEADVAVSVTKAILEGKELNEELKDTFSAECIFDTQSYDNGNKKVLSYLLTPQVITKDNLDELAETGSYKWDEEHKYLEAAS
ncbi:MAG: sugar-binding protein [Firmicutes bacterium]|nr:sugar-binding protein [Bacillota bacterium]